jgi:hypothetical protein
MLEMTGKSFPNTVYAFPHSFPARLVERALHLLLSANLGRDLREGGTGGG